MTVGLFEVPEFMLPFTTTTRAEAQQVNAETTLWALDRGLINEDSADAFTGIGCGHLAARVSGGTSLSDLVTLARWMAWSFVLDDQHDYVIRRGRLHQWRPVARAICGYVEGQAIPAHCRNPLTDAFAELYDRALAGMGAVTAGRFRAHVPQMLRSLDQEAENRTCAGTPAVGDYVLMRRQSSQLPAMLDMSEAALGAEVPAPVHASPVFQELVWSAVDVISWGNDVFSLHKERSCGDTNNLAVLLMRHNGLSAAQAVDDIRLRIAARVEDFLRAERQLPEQLAALGPLSPAQHATVLKCVANHKDWMTGADRWQRSECTRYSDPQWTSGLVGSYTRLDLVAYP